MRAWHLPVPPGVGMDCRDASHVKIIMGALKMTLEIMSCNRAHLQRWLPVDTMSRW